MHHIQLLNEPNKIGGIQSVSSQLEEMFKEHKLRHSKSDLKNIRSILYFLRLCLNDDATFIVHGMSNLITLRSLVLIIFVKIFSFKNNKVIWQPHFHPFDKHRRPLFAAVYFYVVNIFLGKLSNHIIVITATEKKALSKYFDKKKLEIIVNPLKFKGGQTRMQCTPQRKNKDYFLLIGRNDENKNFSAVLKHQDKWLHLASTIKFVTNERKEIPMQFEVLQKISNSQLVELYKNAIAVLIPSHYEAFSLVALEALSLGTPVIGSKNLAITEFECVQNGVRIIDFDVDELSRADVDNLRQGAIEIKNEVNEFFSEDLYRFRWKNLLKF